MSPRDNWEDGNPASGGTSPHCQLGSPPRTCEAPILGSGWSNTLSGSYTEAGTPHRMRMLQALACRQLLAVTFPCSGCSKPMLVVNFWRSTTYDTKFGVSTWYTWGATTDTWMWWFGYDAASGDHEGPLDFSHIGQCMKVGWWNFIWSCSRAASGWFLVSSRSRERVTVFPNEVNAVVPRK